MRIDVFLHFAMKFTAQSKFIMHFPCYGIQAEVRSYNTNKKKTKKKYTYFIVRIITNLYLQLISYNIRAYIRNLKFANFNLRTYKVFSNHNHEIDTETSAGEFYLRLASFFINSLKKIFVNFKRAIPHGCRQYLI